MNIQSWTRLWLTAAICSALGFAAESPTPVLSTTLKPLERVIGEWELLLDDVGGSYIGVLFDENSTNNGAVIVALRKGGPAARAGFKPGDRIVQVDEKKVASFSDVQADVRPRPVGENVRLKYVRDGKVAEMTLTLEGRPVPGYIGIAPEDASNKADSVRVIGLAPGGPGAHAGLQKGDVLLTFDDLPIKNWRRFASHVAMIPAETRVPLRIKRNAEEKLLEVTIKEGPTPPRRIAQVGRGGSAIHIQGLEGTELWYYDPATEKIVHFWIRPVGAVGRATYSKESLEGREYRAEYDLTGANGKQTKISYRTQWIGTDEFSVSSVPTNGDTPTRPFTYRRLK